jgi:flagellar hook assembly protein FlgD
MPTATPIPDCGNFYVSQNCFKPSRGPVFLVLPSGCLSDKASFKIYNSAGENIRSIGLPSTPPAGPLTLTWDGTNMNGEACASGIYLLRFLNEYQLGIKKILMFR